MVQPSILYAMKIKPLTRLREMIEDLLSGPASLRKSFRNFIIETMILCIIMFGRGIYDIYRTRSQVEFLFRLREIPEVAKK